MKRHDVHLTEDIETAKLLMNCLEKEKLAYIINHDIDEDYRNWLKKIYVTMNKNNNKKYNS